MSRSAPVAPIRAIGLTLLLAACGTAGDPPASTDAAAASVADSPAATAEPATPSSGATEAATSPPDLFGTWRTTLIGQQVTLTIGEDFYRIHRGVSQATGEVSVDGDRIDFFGGDLCAGLGEYRWSIDGDSLRFTSLTEECPGRAEALLNVRYGDYSPPSDAGG